MKDQEKSEQEKMTTIYQHPLSIITPVDPSKLEQLRKILNSIQNPDIESNQFIPFPAMQSVHFVRFVLLESETNKYPVQLAFSSDFDGAESSFLTEVIKDAQEGLHQIYTCCIGYNGDLKRYLAQYKVPVNAFYTGHQGVGTNQIKQEDELRKAITNYLDKAYLDGSINNRAAEQIKQMVGSFIIKDNNFAWAVSDKGMSRFQKFIFQRKTILLNIAASIAALILLVFLLTQIFKLLKISVLLGYLVLLAGVVITFFIIKRKLNKLEINDPDYKVTAVANHVNLLTQAENFQVQNQLTHLVDLKPGRFRLLTLRFVLAAINYLAKTVFNKGELGTIPSIHFARWMLTDNNQRLLFFSNFDGSWENYLGDFVDKAAVGLTAVWSNTQGFPKTRNLINEGAQDEQRFKEWTRSLQISTQVWYSAYKTLSVENINNNTLIRSGLFRKMDEANSQAWLDRIFYYKK